MITKKQLSERLHKIQQEFEKLGLEYFIIAALPKTDVGASIYNGKNIKGAAFNARKAHVKWEKQHNIDPNHDNRKKL
ncbi:MAG: hypothetical protein HQ536_03750 [Parcubacteria group bacterium]|nr:hypothetical protein [Parcubacteria group bacterium]